MPQAPPPSFAKALDPGPRAYDNYRGRATKFRNHCDKEGSSGYLAPTIGPVWHALELRQMGSLAQRNEEWARPVAVMARDMAIPGRRRRMARWLRSPQGTIRCHCAPEYLVAALVQSSIGRSLRDAQNYLRAKQENERKGAISFLTWAPPSRLSRCPRAKGDGWPGHR